MKKLMLGCVSIVALGSAVFSGAANAADAAYSSAAAGNYDWSGWYWGLKGGYGSGNARLTAAASTGDYTINGVLFGTMSSLNFQSDNIVYGLDMDSAYANIKGTTSAANAACASCRTQINWLSTVRGRVGIAMDRVLPFVTAGVAFGEAEVTIPGGAGGTDKGIMVGYAVGGGIDWAFADGWHARAEYLYTDLGSTNMAFAGGTTRVDVEALHLVRVGVSMDLAPLYRRVFNGG